MHPRTLALFALGTALLCPTVPAQLPDGWMLAGCYRWSGPQPCPIPGAGGLHAFDPRSGSIQPIAGLPPEVLGNVVGSTWIHGADFAVRVPDTNLVVTNGWGDSTAGQQMPVFVLGLSGNQVVTTQRHDVGLMGPSWWSGSGLPQAQALGDGTVLLGVDPLSFQTGQPLAGTMLAVLDINIAPGPGALSAIPVAPLPAGNLNAMAADPTRGVVWLGIFEQTQSTIFSVPFPQGGAPVAVISLPSQLVSGLALEADGTLLASSHDVNTGAAQLARVDPAGPSSVLFGQVSSLFYAETVRIEPATGAIYLVAGASCGDRDVYRLAPADPVGGVLTMAVSAPAGGWGVVSSLDIDPDPEVYGEPSGTTSLAMSWQVAPSQSGLPRLGNLGFGFELRAPVPPFLVGAVLGLSRASPPVIPGLQVLVNPLTGILLVPGPTMFVPLGIPTAPGLVGLPVFAQAVFLDAGLALGATAGVHATVLP